MMALPDEDAPPTVVLPPSSVARWRQSVPALNRPLDLHLTNVAPHQAVGQLAAAAGMNLVCWDSENSDHLSLHLRGVSVGQVMAVVEHITGGIWKRDHSVYVLCLNPSTSVRKTGPSPHAAMAVFLVAM